MTSTDISLLNTDILHIFNILCDANPSNESCTMDAVSILNVLKYCYYATGDKKRIDLDNNTKIKDILSITPKAQNSRFGIFSRNDHRQNITFKKEFEKQIFIGYIPTDDKERRDINTSIKKNFPTSINNDKDFLPKSIDRHVAFYVKDESYFKGNWQVPFDERETRVALFNCGDNESVMIPTMHAENVKGYRYYCKDLNLWAISLPYKEKYTMLILLPDNVMNKKELLSLCKDNFSRKIIEYISKQKECIYNDVSMPKFDFKSEWQLNINNIYDCDKVPYLSKILDHKTVDFTNMSNSLRYVEDIELMSVSSINNNESGTIVETETFLYAFDSHISNELTLSIDKNFLYLILDNENIINNIGIYLGD